MTEISAVQREEIVRVVRDTIRDELRTELDAVMLKTVASLLTTFGMNDDDKQEIRDDFAYLRRWRKTSENISRGGWIAIMTVLVSGIASAIWLGVKGFLVLKGG